MQFAFLSLGCRLNEAEIERLGRELQAAGHCIVQEAKSADAIILNTCGVTNDAMRKSRNLARRLAANEPQLLVLMGCAVNLGESFSELACKTLLIPNEEKDTAAIQILGAIDVQSDPYPAKLLSFRSHTRSFVKIQDGCNNRCTYCAIWQARGREKSVETHEIIEEIQSLCDHGAKEVILTGVQLGAWNKGDLRLAALLKKILQETPILRLRLSSIEPWHISDELMEAYQNPRLCPQLHIPVQSGSNAVLHAMGRRGRSEEYLEMIHALRRAIPSLRISSDLIVGFPSESEAAWAESCDFLRQAQFDDCHIFRYSARPNTVAARLKQLPPEVKKERFQEAHHLQSKIGQSRLLDFTGEEFSVLWETRVGAKTAYGEQAWEGYTENYIRVKANFPEQNAMRNTISRVKIQDFDKSVAFATTISKD